MIRRILVWLHRWTGLAMAGFLIIVGLTGSLLAFLPELNHWLSPHLFPGPHGAQLGPAALALRAESLVPNARANKVYMGEAGKANIEMEPRPGTAQPPDVDEVVLDSVTGAELVHGPAHGIPARWEDVMPFVYRLHYALAMGDLGVWILGIVALAWTLDCFAGFYLTLPVSRGRFWERWKSAWSIKWRASAYRFNFDVHRAGGLWLWAMLFIFAWSSVAFNLNSVYMQVTRLVFDFTPSQELVAPLPDQPVDDPAIGWAEAQGVAERLMAEKAREHHFTAGRAMAFYLDRASGTYEYRVRSSRDVDERYGYTAVYFDANTGAFKKLSLPSGQSSGDTLTAWFAALHKAHVFGMPYRIFVCAMGLAVTILSLTGIYLVEEALRAKLLRVAP